MIAAGVVLLELLCCLGLGAAAMRVLKIDGDVRPGEHFAIAFAVGFGILGWLVFPLGISGYLSNGPMGALLAAGSLGVVLLWRSGTEIAWPSADAAGRILLALLGVIVVFDLLEGIAPPADADTLAYHFDVPKRFLAAGRIEFILWPLEGSIPFLAHMTYLPVLALGGEPALTAWTMISGWAPAALLFVLCRRHLDFNWSLAVTLVFLSTPAVIYGAGSGQVEPRLALFVMVAAWATARALETGRINYAVLAGLGAGFFAGAKFTGLLFAAVSGLVLVFQRRWLVHGAVFSVAFLAAGFQWYAWNGIHTGDPVFPMLFQWLGRDDLTLWPKAYDLVFKAQYFGVENPLPTTLPWLLYYPFKATLDFATLPDAGRVGFGPYGLLALPFAAFGLWRFRHRVRRSPLFTYASLALLFYVLWFFAGGSQRIRHLLPVWPLFLLSVTVAAERFTADGKNRRPLLAAVVCTLLLQTAGHGLFAVNYIKFLANGADREAFLLRNVDWYVAVPWINANLTGTDRIFIIRRQLRYYLRVPSFLGSDHLQAAVELRPGATDVRTLHRQLRRAGITHFLLIREGNGDAPTYFAPLEPLHRAGCLTPLMTFKQRQFRSRTLPTLSYIPQTADVLRLRDEGCLG